MKVAIQLMKDTYKQKGMVDQITTAKATHLQQTYSQCVSEERWPN